MFQLPCYFNLFQNSFQDTEKYTFVYFSLKPTALYTPLLQAITSRFLVGRQGSCL